MELIFTPGPLVEDDCGWDRVQYSYAEGLFEHDSPATANKAGMTAFGLIKREYPTDYFYDPHFETPQWNRFAFLVDSLNNDSGDNSSYKVLYLARHGQGEHNVAESKHGTHEWERFWAKRPEFTDAQLTSLGCEQSRAAANIWSRAIHEEGVPAPQSYYTSPHIRCLETARLTFGALDLPEQCPFAPLVMEDLREIYGIHTCDKRSRKSVLVNSFPGFEFETGFSEDDELWSADYREPEVALKGRVVAFLNFLFTNDSKKFLSITSHGGIISTILKVVGHPGYQVQPGGSIAILVKGEWH